MKITSTLKDGSGSGGPLPLFPTTVNASIPDEPRHGLWLCWVGATTPFQLSELASHPARIICVYPGGKHK